MLCYAMLCWRAGTLPRKEVEQFRALSDSRLMKQLKEVNEELRKYASVNKKVKCLSARLS